MFGGSSESTLQKRNVTKQPKIDESGNVDSNSERNANNSHLRSEPKLTLMEELLLLVMDPEGFISVWNDHVSRALRGCILIELWMRGKIELEPVGMRRKSLLRRMVKIKNDSPTDNFLLNEALRFMKGSTACTVPDWISYLCGETWNPLKFKYHMRSVRERLFKELAERGVLSTVRTDYLVLDFKTHPIKDFQLVKRLRSKIRDALLERYSPDLSRIDTSTLALLVLTQYSGRLAESLNGLPSDLDNLANERMRQIEGANFEDESRKNGDVGLHWAVFSALNDFTVLF